MGRRDREPKASELKAVLREVDRGVDGQVEYIASCVVKDTGVITAISAYALLKLGVMTSLLHGESEEVILARVKGAIQEYSSRIVAPPPEVH